jgi:hypothetical protein
MTKWLVLMFFALCMVAAMRIEQLWTLWLLIPAFSWLYLWAESLEDAEAPLQDRTCVHYID